MTDMKCPISGVNIPRFLSATIAGAIFLYAFEYIVHVHLLMDTYQQTPQLWLSVEAMQENAAWGFVRLFALVAAIGYLYTRNHEGKGADEGVRFGLAVGAILGISMASSYLWMPISGDLAVSWLLTGIGKGLGIGVIFSLMYVPCGAKKSAKPAVAVAQDAPLKKTSARKTARKKATVKKAPAKKAPAKKAPAKKTAAKKAPAKKAPAKKTTAKKPAAKKAPAKKK